MLLISMIHNLTLGFVVPGYNTEQAETCNVQVYSSSNDSSVHYKNTTDILI